MWLLPRLTSWNLHKKNNSPGRPTDTVNGGWTKVNAAVIGGPENQNPPAASREDPDVEVDEMFLHLHQQ